MSDSLFITLQKILPKLALTRLAGIGAASKGGGATRWAIERFVYKYEVDMSEAANPDMTSYPTFNAFFTRALKEGARPIANAPWVCPVDGAISQFGPIVKDQIFQAKGHHYSTQALLGGDANLAKPFDDGHFATIYLSPRDYHRIHMPAAGRLRTMIHVPGDLYSVNPATARAIPGLFARNERVVCVFDPIGDNAVPFILVLVGATIVGSMATTWHGLVNPPRPNDVRTWHYNDQTIDLAQGAEMGRFLLGSTVVLLWPKSTIRFNETWAAGGAVKLGTAMGCAMDRQSNSVPK